MGLYELLIGLIILFAVHEILCIANECYLFYTRKKYIDSLQEQNKRLENQNKTLMKVFYTEVGEFEGGGKEP